MIVGTGHAGAQAAILLRQNGFDGSIALVGEEADPPYERPPLSKEYLAGEKQFERILIRPAAFWDERRISLVLGAPVVELDAAAKVARTRTGESFSYRTMIWATGGSPRRLDCPGADLAGVHTVRHRTDVDRILSELDGTGRIAIIGGGYIGLETAAVLNKLGKQIVLVETCDRLLSRVAGQEVSDFYAAEHRGRGVDLRLSQALAAIEGRDGRASAIRLSSGEKIDIGMVIAGIGIAPAVEPLRAAGAAGTDGVDVDPYCRTSLADVFAIGDCAAHENAFAGGARVRIESVQNAHDQAATAVRAILGAPEPYRSIPWFWSNQYDLRLQSVGLAIGHDRSILRGSIETRSFSLIYLKQGRVIALDCVNATRDYAQGRRLIVEGVAPDLERLTDPAHPLKSLLEDA